MSGPSGPSSPEGLRNCLSCKQRKVRCDRKQPCSSCTRHNRNCIFPTSGRALRRPAPRSGSSRTSDTARTQLLARICQLEAVVDSLSEHVKAGAGDGHVFERPQLLAQASLQPDLSGRQRFGQSAAPRLQTGERGVMLSGSQGKVYVGDSYWAMVQLEVKLIRERLEEMEVDDYDTADSAEDQDTRSSPSAIDSLVRGPSSFVFRNSSPRERGSGNTRPLPSQTLFLWHTFLENVSPFIKILHGPSLSTTIHEARGNIAKMDESMEPLMLAISLAAVFSLTDEEVRVNFEAERDHLLLRYRVSTEEALTRADFINTSQFPVVQAFTLYLFVNRSSQSTRYLWSMSGLLIRIAVSLGLHRDGSIFPEISIFDAEMRRRLWWVVCFMDFTAGDRQITEMSMHPGLFDTHLPANVDDADLDPTMTQAPTPRDGFTDATLCVLQGKSWQASSLVKRKISTLGLDRTSLDWSALRQSQPLADFNDVVFGQLLCDVHPDQPLQMMALRMATVFSKQYELMMSWDPQCILSPPVGGELAEDEPFRLSLAILKETEAVQDDPTMRKWLWKANGFIQWQPVTVLLSRICRSKWDSSAEEGLRVVTRCLIARSDAIRQEPLWKPVSELLKLAQKQRNQQMAENMGQEASTRPVYFPQPTGLGAGQVLGMADQADANHSGRQPMEAGPDQSPASLQELNSVAGDAVESTDLSFPLDLLTYDNWNDIFCLDDQSLL